MPKYCFNYDSGDYEHIEEDGYSWEQGGYVYNWDDSEYRRQREAEEEEEYRRRREEEEEEYRRRREEEEEEEYRRRREEEEEQRNLWNDDDDNDW